MLELQMARRGTSVIFQVVACGLILAHRHEVHTPDGIGTADEIIWPCLAISFYFHARCCVVFFSVPFRTFGIFSLVVERLMMTDVPLFLTFFLLYLANFTGTLFLLYPRAGTGTLPYAADFNDPRTAVKSMVQFGFAGSKFQIEYLLKDMEPDLCTSAADTECGCPFPEELSLKYKV